MNVSTETKQRISKEFNDDEGPHVISALCDFEWSDIEPDRVHRIILDYAKGKVSEVKRLVKVANDDPKRILAADNPTKKKSPKKQILPKTILIFTVLNILTWIILKYIVQFK